MLLEKTLGVQCIVGEGPALVYDASSGKDVPHLRILGKLGKVRLKLIV